MLDDRPTIRKPMQRSLRLTPEGWRQVAARRNQLRDRRYIVKFERCLGHTIEMRHRRYFVSNFIRRLKLQQLMDNLVNELADFADEEFTDE